MRKKPPAQLLLFSEIVPVSEQEVSDYLNKIPSLSPIESRRDYYRKNWNVVGKIRDLKLKELE
jgi:hypothetical protein